MIANRINIAVLIFLSAFALMLGCATPGSPSGGPRDETPPRVIEEESSPNPMTNFDLYEIRITFDEWINLRDPATQIVISPPVEPRIMPQVNRKSVVIPIDPENLRDSTTYLINFGEAVQDITERNPAKDLLYVFSTGPFVDSLTLSGEVFDARTGEGVEGARVILHDNPSDTAISKLLPAYFTSTDETGSFTLRFLRSDTFRVFAILEGEFGNYRYDFGEQLGFITEPVFISDTLTTAVTIPLYTPRVPLKVITSYSGMPQKISLTRELIAPGISGDSTDMSNVPLWRSLNDTLYIWYTGTDTTDVVLLENNEPFDTLNMIPQQFNDIRVAVNMSQGIRHPGEPVTFTTQHPIAFVDKDSIRIRQGDTLLIAEFNAQIDSNDATRFRLAANWQPESRYTIEFLPGAVENIFGNSHDTLNLTVRFPSVEEFARLNLTIQGLTDSVQYLIELLDGENVYESITTIGTDSLDWVLERLPVKPYEARIVEDINGNAHWDTGDLAAKRQPERIFTVPIDGMRPGWDLDFSITWPEE